jgi:flagellar basal-body rod modification protein FlgD
MDIPSSLSIDNRLAALNADHTRANDQLGRDSFLNLLVTQLENQDPLSPLQDHEFVAQLATFSSLEQLESINSGMQASLLMSQSVNNSLATNLIGKEVLAEGGEVTLGEDDEPSFQLELDRDAAVTVEIRDATGTPVRHLDLGLTSGGASTVRWDGDTDTGGRAAPGKYTISITAIDEAGQAVAASAKVRALVEAVRFMDGTGYLVVNGTTIPLSSVQEVLAAGS